MNKFFKPHEISSHQRHGQDKEQDCDRPDSASFGGSGVFSSSTTNGSALSYLRDLSFSSHRTSGEPSGDATADRVQSSAMDRMNSGSEGSGHKRQHEPNSSRIGSIMQDLPDKTSSHSQDAEVSSESAEVSYLRRLSPINSVADPDENKSHGSSSAAGHNPLLASSPVKDDSDIILPSNFDSIIGMKRSNSFPHIGSVSDVDMLSISDSFFDDARSSIIGGGNDGGSSITGSLRSRRGGSSGIVSGSLRRPGGSTANPVYSSGISTVSFNLRDEPESFCDQHRYTPPEPGSYARSVRANRINQAANSSTMSANSVSGMSVKSGGSESDDGDAR